MDASPEIRPSKKSHSQSKLKTYIMYALFLILVATAAVLLCVFAFFRVHSVYVTGNSQYADTDILDVADINTGDNVVMLETALIEERLLERFPYIESVSINKKLPVTIEIEINEAKPDYSVVFGENMYAYVSGSRKLLEAKESPAAGSIIVHGGEVQDVNGTLVFADENVMNAFDIIVAAIANYPNSGITEMDISNIYDVSLIYENRIKLDIGGVSDFDYKLGFGYEIVTGGSIGSDEYGILDLTLSKDVDKAYFAPLSSSSGFEDVQNYASFEEYLEQKELEEQLAEAEKEDEEDEAGEGDEGERDEPVEERGDDIPDSPYQEDSGDDSTDREYGTDAGRGNDIPDVN